MPRQGVGVFRLRPVSGIVLAVWLAGAAGAHAQTAATRASRLMDQRLYADAAKLLAAEVESQGESALATELRLLGECHYMMGDYAKARPYFARALTREQSEQSRIVCESRLALIAYRLNDTKGAEERIENFLRKYPTDARAGTLLVVQIKMIGAQARPPAEKVAQIEPLFARIAENKKLYGYHNSVIASQVLGDLYVKVGREKEAIGLFTTAVHEMRGLVVQFKNDGRPIPPDLMNGLDSMSLQIADFYIERRDWNEAVKWLENVAHVGDLVRKAKLLLAQIAYQRGEHRRVIESLTEKLLETIPPGDLKSSMYLLLGYSFREMDKPDIENAKKYLKLVEPKSSGFAQAQHGLGDIYRDEKDDALAEKYYLESVKAEKYAAPAQFHLGQILLRRAQAMANQTEKERAARLEVLQAAAAWLETLVNKYPLTSMAKEARPILEQLQQQGVKVTIASSDEDKLRLWEQTVREQPDSNAAAQALISMAEFHSRTLYDEKGKTVLKPANWEACAKACHGILKNGDRPFSGIGADRWREVTARALYLLAMAELGSLPPGPSAVRRAGPQATPKADGGNANRAADNLQRALDLLPKEGFAAFRKDLDLALLEAMFKSDSDVLRQTAEKRYAERQVEFASDPQYQRLEMVLADWYGAHDQFEAAAKTYRRAARQSHLEREEIMRLLYLAGVNFNKAGRDAAAAGIGQKAHLGFYVYPKETIVTASPLRAHPIFRVAKKVPWKPGGPDPAALDVLQRVSRGFGVPFVWIPSDAPGSVANALRTGTVPLSSLAGAQPARTLEQFLALILDPNRYKIEADLGATGGTPTIPPPKADELETEEIPPTVEIWDTFGPRFPTLARDYGAFSQTHRGIVMLFHVVQRVESLTGSRVFWDDVVDRENALAYEFKALPGEVNDKPLPCDEVLRLALQPLGLSVRVVRRDRTVELVESSNDCFNELRKFGMDTQYAEEAMFNLAVNFFYLKDYEKMKLVLREYLKVYDTPSHRHYYDACFWLGWNFERERKFRDAVKHYLLAAEEKLVLYKLPAGGVPPSLDALKQTVGYETLFNLMLKASGQFKDYRLADQFLSFIRFNTNVDIKLDPSAAAIETPINQPAFAQEPCLNLLHGVMQEFGLGLRAENGDKDVAEKAYFRLAATYMKDNLLAEAMENINTLLSRFPRTRRAFDAHKLKLDIYKGLKDYARAIETLELLRSIAPEGPDSYKLDYEAGRLYFDMCDYDRAEQFYARVLSNAGAESEWLTVREALAHTYLRRREKYAEALSECRSLLQYETSALRSSVHTLLIYFLESVIAGDGPKPEFPPREMEFIRKYEALTDAQRSRLGQNDIARVTWVYYVQGMLDLAAGRFDDAIKQLDAASVSPDAFMAGDALVQIGKIYMSRQQFREAKDVFQHLLFAVDAVEPAVRATYLLALCHEQLGQPDAAFRRYEEVLAKYPVSPYAAQVKAQRLYLERTGRWPPPGMATNAVASAGAATNAVALPATNAPGRAAATNGPAAAGTGPAR